MAERKAQYPVLDLLKNRWSPRSMTGESISKEELFSLFEGARWSASSYNNQPWRFIYAMRDEPAFEVLFNLLKPQNQGWTKNAAVLIVVISRTLFEYDDRFSITHSFDTGAAAENMALQAFSIGLAIRGMEGFSYERAREELNIPQEYAVEAMFAVGRKAPEEALEEEYRIKDQPTDRKPVDEFVYHGIFGKKP
jgi:nitroreductase